MAFRLSGVITKRSGQGIAAAVAAVLSLLVTAYLIVGGGAAIGGTSSPPGCSDAPGTLVTPTGRPVLTVSQGANHWISNLSAEPLALAVYADGTVIGSLEIGQVDKPLAPMVIAHVPSCVLAWATTQVERLSALEIGEPEITDQGTTEVTYQPTVGAERTIQAYALGEGDAYVGKGRANRVQLTKVLAALRKPLSGAATWTPDRLRLVEWEPDRSAAPALVWPGSRPLTKVLTGRRMGSLRCGEVSGAAAAAVRGVLGDRDVYSTWTDGTLVTGLDIGALVPGQAGCDG